MLVSIHPMCRFKEIQRCRLWDYIRVSIHPMCRFKELQKSKPAKSLEFQYILCVGSSIGCNIRCHGKDGVSIHLMCRFKKSGVYTLSYLYSFNTSYVSVQDKREVLFLLVFAVSIHLMCRFKSSW